MATLFPPVLEAKAQAIPYAEQVNLDTYYNIEFKMPDVNPIDDIGHIQVSIKYQSTNEAAVNRNRSPDGNVLYFNKAESHNYFHLKDNGNYEISIPYLCFDGGRPREGVTYCVQVRFGNAVLWTNGSGISEGDFGGFAAWRAVQVSAVPSRFGEWSNVQTVYCYGSAAVSLTANYNDFVPELEYRYAPVLDDPLEQIKIVYEYADLYGSTFKTLVFNGQRQQDGVYTLRVKLPIAPVQRILVSLEAITKNNTIRGRTLTIVPLKFSQIFPVLQHDIDPKTEKEIPLIEEVKLYDEEGEDGCLAKKVSIPAQKIAEDGTLIPDNPAIYKDGSTLSIYRANVYSLETVKIVEGLNADRGASTVFKDYSVEMGEDYQYIAVLKDADGIAYALVENVYDWGYDNPGYARLMHMDSVFLTTRNHQLRLQGNVNITGFKRNTQDQFQTTLGSQFPFYQRNAKMNYRTFTLTGVVTANHDPTGSFLRNDNENGLWWDDENGSRLVVLNRDLYSTKQFSISRARMYDYFGQKPKIEALDERKRSEIFNIPDAPAEFDYLKNQFGQKTFYDDYLYRNIIPQISTDKTDENVYYERKFREFVMLWLSDGKPKLFRSETEGNMIVMISGVSFTPQDKSSRMVYSLSCTVTEIAEYNMQNLLDYNLIPFSFQTFLITALPRNLTYGDKVDPQDYVSIIGLDSSLESCFTYDGSSGTYIVNRGADLDKLNEVINSVNEYTFIRGDLDEDVYSGLIYQYNKIYNIPDLLAGVAMKQINTFPAVRGGSGDYAFSVPVLDGNNKLPDGLTIDSKTGIISGIPTLPDDESEPPRTVTLAVHDNSPKDPLNRDATMTISVGTVYSQLRLNPASLVDGSNNLLKATIAEEKVGTNITPINLSDIVLGGFLFTDADTSADFDYVWSAEGLPQGFTINNYGVLTGAYTEIVEPGEAKITVTDAAGQQVTAIMKFGQGYFPIYFYPSMAFNVPYSEQGVQIDPIDVSSGVSGGKQQITQEYPHGYSFSAEGLPAGLTIDKGTGIISGAPENPGNAVTATITATDFDNPPSSASITILVQEQLEKFEFNGSARLFIDDGGYVPGANPPQLAPIMLGTVIDPIQVLIQGNQKPGSDNPDDLITYDMAEVRGGLRYVDKPYYRFSSEYLIPDFEITNNGVISGRAQVASKGRTAILKVFDARNKMQSYVIQVAEISSRMTFEASDTYALPDTFVNSNKPDYRVQIPTTDIKYGNHPLTYKFNGVPAGMKAEVRQDALSQKEYIIIEKDPNSANWPSAAQAAGYITIEVSDTPANGNDIPETIKIKIPVGTIVPLLRWDQGDTILPPLAFGQTKKVFLTGITGGIYPYTVRVVSGDPSPWVIRQTEGAEQDPNQFYFYGEGTGASDSDDVILEITDASGQISKPVRFIKNASYDGLTFSMQNSMQTESLVVGLSEVPGAKGQLVVIQAHGGDGKYEYLVRDNSANEIIPGIKLDPITGALSGTPEKIDSSADLTGKFTVKDGTGAYGTWDRNTAWYSPNVSDVIRYLDGVGETYKESFYTLRQSYSKTFFQPNNNTKLTFSIQGDLPPGLVLNTSTGRISGTFTGTFTNKTVILTATIPADDFNPTPITKTVTITFPGVGSFLEYEIVPTNLTINPLVIGRDIGRIDISQGLTGGSPDFTWTLEGDIPPGIRIEKDPNDSSKAYLVGIPNTVMDSGGLLTIRVNDSAGNTASADLVWNGIYDNLSVTGAENLKIPAQKAYVQIEEINIASIITVNGGSGNFQYSDGGTIKPYSISLSGIISGYTGAAAQAEKTGTITITDTVTGVTLNVPITVGEIEGGMIYTGNPSIDPGRIGTAFTSVNLKAGVSGGGTPKFTLASTPSSWATGTINLDPNTGILSGTRPTKNAAADVITVALTDTTTTLVNITITIQVGAVSGETLSYQDDATSRAIPAGTRNTQGTVNLKPGFTGLTDPTFTVVTRPAGWAANAFSFTKDAVLSYRRPNTACAEGTLTVRVNDSGQTITISIPVGAVT